MDTDYLLPLQDDLTRRGRARGLSLIPTFIVVAVDATGLGIILPLLPFYSERLGATPLVIGALVSVYAVCQLVAGPVVGMLSDRYGRRKVLVVSQIGTLAGFLLLAVANSLTLVFLARIVDGLTSGNISVAYAYAAEHSTPDTRKQALGATSGAIGTGLLVGPALSGFLVQYGSTAPVWAAALLSLISILATVGLLPADASERLYMQRISKRKAARTMLGMRYAWGILGLLIIFFFVNSMFLSQIALFLSARFSWNGHSFGARELGCVFAYAGFINMIVQGLLITRANALASDRTIVVAAFACMGTGFCGIAVTTSVGLLAVFLTMINLGAIFIRGTLTAELSRSAAINRQGVMMGLNQSLMSGANIVAPLMSGALIGHRFYVAWALTMVTIVAAGALMAAGVLQPPGAQSRNMEKSDMCVGSV
ncbi:MFS transporter [Bradyrhizobium sp. INPA01-394B]|uniref:MFS transporter n=1 Tax=Bradyrhizobium campsiandrae TaxID=1729892 RepID=A0ABR7U6K1_9BRAD|nr:MFS transporter [Bradyrhizobium campsiandrae]MBC9881410.1 MFS transporter [Bradyrhizobium campsiandrae]MBC9979049.1 MFS transporter [Bradyrhizobium campsiandrae]